MKTRILSIQCLLLVGAVTLWTTSVVVAADKVWNLDGNGVWTNDVNWNPNVAPVSVDTAWLTNAISVSRVITQFNSSVTIDSLIISNSAATATHTLLLSNAFLKVNNTATIGNHGILQIGVNNTSISTGMFNNLSMGAGTITFGHTLAGGGTTDVLIVTGSFANTSASTIKSVGGNWSLVYSNNSEFVNNGAITWENPVNTGRGTITVAAGAGTNTLRNSTTGTILISKAGSVNNVGTFTLNANLVNQGTIIFSNAFTAGASGASFYNILGRPGQAVTNDTTGSWTLFARDGSGTGTGVYNQNVTITNGGFVNLGTLTSIYQIANPSAGLKTNSIALSTGQTFSNASGGQVIVAASSNPTNTTFLIRADRAVNAGTNLVYSGALSYVNSAGTAAVPLENSGLLRIDGRLAASTVTNSGVVQGTGTIQASVFNLSGGKMTPGNSIGTNSVIGNVTFGSNATFSVELSLVNGSSDLLGITGSLTLDANSILDITGGIAGNIYTVATFNVSSLTGNFGTVTPGYTVGYDNAGGALTLIVVPEPNALVLVGAGLFGLVMVTKRRRR